MFQLYLLADGQLGEARPAPAVPGTVEYLAWSPDGTRILLGVAGLGAEMADAQGSGTAGSAESGLPSWYPEVEAGTPEDAWRSLWLYTPASGELAKVSPDGLNVWEAAWSGPGHVLAITSEQPSEDDWYSAVLSRLDISTGEVTELLRSDVQLGLPAGTSDGTRAAVVQAVCSDRWIVAGDLILLDLAAGTRCAVDTAGTDVTAVQWIDANAARLRRPAPSGQRGRDRRRRGGTPAGDDHRQGTGRVRAVVGELVLPGGRLHVRRPGRRDPGRLRPSAGDRDRRHGRRRGAGLPGPCGHRLPPIGRGLGDERQLERTRRDADRRNPVHAAGTGPFPLVLHVHGGPIGAYQRSWSMHDYAVPLLVSRGYAVLHPNPRGSSGRGQEFAAAVVGDMGGADTYDYLSGIDAMIERGIADPARIGTMGVSYGGFMSAWLVTQDQRFKAAVAGSPVTEWYSFTFTTNIPRWGLWFLDNADPEEIGNQVHTRSPVMHASKARTPTLLTAGAKDRCTPAGQAREFYQALIGHGVDSELVIYPGEGHGVSRFPAVTDYLTRLVTWFERYMPA